MRIAQFLNHPARTCRADDTLEQAARTMWDHDLGALPVVDAQDAVIGVVTDRDLCMAALTQGAPLHAIPVRTAMSRELHCCNAEESVDAVLRTMREHQVRRVPIVDAARRPLGIVSLGDLARDAARPASRTSTSERSVVETLAAICLPRSQAAPAAGTQPRARAATTP